MNSGGKGWWNVKFVGNVCKMLPYNGICIWFMRKSRGNIYAGRHKKQRKNTVWIFKRGFITNVQLQIVREGKDKFGLYRHFNLRHPNADIMKEQDGRLEKCSFCGMRAENMNRHHQSNTCAKARMRRKNEERQDLQAKAEAKEIKINGVEIERLKTFRYLGRILSEDDCDSKCIDDQLRRARKK